MIAHKGRGLTPRQLRFWGLVYDLPVRQVNSWIRADAKRDMGKPMKYSTDGSVKKTNQRFEVIGRADVVPEGFYLAGGTALTIHLSHRISVDLDWFTSAFLRRWDDPCPVAPQFQMLIWSIEQVSPGTLHGSVNGVRCDFPAISVPAS